jgi:signal transduction histidine kinase
VHFTQDQGRVTVALSVIKKDAQPWVELTVEDNGPGITVEEREHLFERFYRGRLAKSGHIPGSGLGLVIAKSVVKAHGGVLRLLSCDDNGSKFLIRLRAKDEAR